MNQDLTLTDTTATTDICSNCGTQMYGTYCAKCGQATRHFIKFFPSVIKEMLEDTFDIDGRFFRTIWALLAKPGRLTTAFLTGRRVHYSPPFRLYLFTSLAAFLVFSLAVSSFKAEVNNGDADPLDGVFVTSQKAGENSRDNQQEDANTDPGNVDAADQDDSTENEEFIVFELNGEPWHYQDNPIAIDWLPSMVNQALNSNLYSIEQNSPRIIEDPTLLIRETLRIMPTVLFILLPIYALILKLLYVFKRRYYMEHLIYSVHMHTATLFVLMLAITLDLCAENVAEKWRLVFEIPETLLLIWYFLYMFLAQKHVYQQGWFMTGLKSFALNTIYFIFSMVAQIIAVVIGAATL